MLKLPQLLIACVAVGPFLAAQGSNSTNPVEVNNEPYILVSGSTHSTTGMDYNDAFNNPLEFQQAGTGIPANTWAWRLFPQESNDMRERRVLTGIQCLAMLSAATPMNSSANAYIPAYAVIGAKQRGNNAPAGALDPDFSTVYVRTLELSPIPITVTNQLLGTSITFNTPLSVSIVGDHAIAARYHGGEQRDKAADSTNFSQSLVGSIDDGPIYDDLNTPYQPDGFASWDPDAVVPTPATVSYKLYDDSRTYLTYYTDNPTVNIYSAWGTRRADYSGWPSPNIGLSDGTYYSDIGTSPLAWGWEVWADPALYGGGFVLSFVNFGAYFDASVVIGAGPLRGPVTAELSPFDPAITSLLHVVMLIDPTSGIADSGLYSFPTTVPGMIGKYLAVECVVFPSASAPSQRISSTQARYIRIVK